jgi:hypothetical protein
MSLKSEQVRPKVAQSQRFMDQAQLLDGAQGAEPAAGEILILCLRLPSARGAPRASLSRENRAIVS